MVERPGFTWENGGWRPETEAERNQQREMQFADAGAARTTMPPPTDNDWMQTEGGPPPNPNQEVDDAEAEMQGYLQIFRTMGWDDAARMLDYYLKGPERTRWTGENQSDEIRFSRDEARSFKPIAETEQRIEEHYERDTFQGITKRNPEPKKLLTMKDGQTITFKDPMVSIFNDEGPIRTYLDPSVDRNAINAFGQSNIQTSGNFTATRQGNRIYIHGDVTFNWNDKFDFEEGKPGAGAGHTLERHGKAAPFQFGSAWRKQVQGSVEIKNGKLGDPKFTWRDLD